MLGLLAVSFYGLDHSLRKKFSIETQILSAPHVESNLTESLNIIEKCNNKPLDDSASCAVHEIRKFFKYNLSNRWRNMTFDELKEEGGICWQWAQLYQEIGLRLNFYATTKVIYKNSTTTHMITIWSNDDGYCVIDQTGYWCN